MRVLFLTHRLPYAPNRGDRIRAHHILRTLAERAEVDLVSLVHDAEEESHAPDLLRLANSVTVMRVGRLRGWIRGAGALVRSTPLTHALLDAPGICTGLKDLVAARRPDVVLAYGSGMARFALDAPLSSLPYVFDMVDVDSAKWQALGTRLRGPRGWIYKREASVLALFETAAACRAQATIVVNDREGAALERLAPATRRLVIPNGIDADFFRPPALPAHSAGVVFCGVFNYAPNEEAATWFIREVWPQILSRRADAKLTLVGSHPTSALREVAGRYAAVEVTGVVPDVRPYLWRSALSIAPIWTARGVQNKVLEAAAAGLPSVVTPAVFDGLPAEVAPACRIAQSAESFAASVLALLAASPADRRATADAADLRPLRWSSRLAPLVEELEAAASAATRSRSATVLIPATT